MSDELIYAAEDNEECISLPPWKVLIVDDEEHIHVITKTVLRDFTFEHRSLAFTSAYTSKEAMIVLQQDTEFALVLLDVVMETMDAGLLVVKAIREELHNDLIRIVLRTGEPNSAPERKIIEQYEIHDYKDKTELNHVKLMTTIISALRSFRDLKKIKENEILLEKKVAQKTHDLISLNAQLEARVKEQSLHMLQQSRYAEMGETLAMIAHQWKQPLSAISAVINNLLSKYSLGLITLDMLPKDLHRIEDMVLHLSSTIEAFGDFFKPSKTKEICNMCSIIDSALELTSVTFAQNNIDVKKEGKRCPSILSFKNELKQVVLNLLNNSKDSLIYHKTKEPLITISIIEESDRLLLSFEDNGGGIEENILPKVFEPYMSTKSKNGTGLGLYMSKVIIQEHCGGNIDVVNTDNGAIFTITLPLQEVSDKNK